MYIMSYSKDATQSMYFAVSEDMLHWRFFNDGNPVLSLASQGKIIRDPFWFTDKEGLFHAIYTDNWNSNTIGHATSTDLLHWELLPSIPLMGDNADVANCWAPELFEDNETGEWVLIWSTSFYSQNTKNRISNRIYSCRTRDFLEFTPAKLFFDPGYQAIDATMIYKDGIYHMAFKDERGHNSPDSPYCAIRTAISKQPEGPFVEISPLITPWRSEGPIFVLEGDTFYLFYDCFNDQSYRGIKSNDFKNWTDISTQMDFPTDCKHVCIRKYEGTQISF